MLHHRSSEHYRSCAAESPPITVMVMHEIPAYLREAAAKAVADVPAMSAEAVREAAALLVDLPTRAAARSQRAA